MSDTKLDPTTLNAEERAIVDRLATDYGTSVPATAAYEYAQKDAKPFILARRALFSPAAESARCQHSHEFHGDVWECQRESGHSGSHECKSWSELGKKGAEHPEPKVECPNCEQRIDYEDQHLHEGDSPHVVPFFTCQPAQPEPTTPVGNEDCQKAKAEGPWLAEVLKPAAPEREMPEAVDKACDLLEWGGNISAAAALRAAWRSQPVAVGISEELDRRAVEIGGDRLVGVSYRPVSETAAVGTWQLEELLKYADLAEVALRTGFHPPEFLFRPADRSLRQVIDAVKKQRDEQRNHAQPVGISEELEDLLDSIMSFADVDPDTQVKQIWRKKVAAVREQYAHAQPRPKLEKTRRALKCGQERLNIVFLSEETTTRWNNLFYEALAELDAAEGR